MNFPTRSATILLLWTKHSQSLNSVFCTNTARPPNGLPLKIPRPHTVSMADIDIQWKSLERLLILTKWSDDSQCSWQNMTSNEAQSSSNILSKAMQIIWCNFDTWRWVSGVRHIYADTFSTCCTLATLFLNTRFLNSHPATLATVSRHSSLCCTFEQINTASIAKAPLCENGAFNVETACIAASMKVGWLFQLAVTLMIVANCEAGKWSIIDISHLRKS